MRTKIIIQLGFLLLLSGATATAQTYAGSSKCSFSKTSHGSVQPDDSLAPTAQDRLARVTAYWPGEDHYTSRRQSATGVRLRLGYCAVDSRIIPHGSLVTVFGVGNFLAVDTGTAVISRKAARESGHNREERSALVIDLFFPSRRAGERFDREGPKFALVAWQSADTLARD